MRTDPIIITGAGHSGTRGLVQVLTKATNVYLGDINNSTKEWEFYRQLAAEVNGRLLGLPARHNYHAIAPEIFTHFQLTQDEKEDATNYIRQKILANQTISLPPDDATHWVIKTPRTTLCLEVWQAVFPQARFVNLVRDGRDVAASLPDSGDSLLRRFELWRARVNRIWWYQRNGIPIIDFRYEDLTDPAKLKSLCDSLNIPYLPEMHNQLKMSVGKGRRKMRGLAYERMELLRYGYPKIEKGWQAKIAGTLQRFTDGISNNATRINQKLNRNWKEIKLNELSNREFK